MGNFVYILEKYSVSWRGRRKAGSKKFRMPLPGWSGGIFLSMSRPPASVHFGDFTFDLGRGELRQRGEIIRLTDRERAMLRLLAENPGETVARETLSGLGVAANERTVDVQMNRLRRKIERDPSNPLYLQTARGAGYRLLVDH